MTTTYVQFNPPRRTEEYAGLAGPHNGLALEHNVLAAMGEAKIANRPHPFLVLGEWRRDDGVTFLDIAVDRAWVTAHGYELHDGMLRWVCPGCGRLSGAHSKGCEYR